MNNIIDLNKVNRVYSGNNGCCCGCNGKYTTPAESPRRAKVAITKITRALAMSSSEKAEAGIEDCAINEDYAYIMTATRTNIVYFN